MSSLWVSDVLILERTASLREKANAYVVVGAVWPDSLKRGWVVPILCCSLAARGCETSRSFSFYFRPLPASTDSGRDLRVNQ